MGDAIFGDTSNEDSNESGVVELTTEQWDQVKAKDVEQAAQLTVLSKQLEDQAKMLAESQKPAPLPSPTATTTDPSAMSADEALAAFAKDPAGYTTAVANGQISKAINEQLAPLLNPIIATTHQGIVASHQQAFDIKYGVGKFDELIKPTLQQDLESLAANNTNAMADGNTVKALIERIEGTKRVEINEAEAGAAKAREDADAAATARIVATLPPSMQPKPAGGVKEITAETSDLFDSIERTLGSRPDKDVYLATQNADPGVAGYVAAMKELEGKPAT